MALSPPDLAPHPLNNEMTSSPDSTITIATMNIQGQSGLSETKQFQIQDFIKYNNVDILHCQEIEITSKSFRKCHFLNSHYNVIQNNSPINKYGTATFVRNSFDIENVRFALTVEQ